MSTHDEVVWVLAANSMLPWPSLLRIPTSFLKKWIFLFGGWATLTARYKGGFIFITLPEITGCAPSRVFRESLP